MVCQGTESQDWLWVECWLFIQGVRASEWLEANWVDTRQGRHPETDGSGSRETRAGTGQWEAGSGSVVMQETAGNSCRRNDKEQSGRVTVNLGPKYCVGLVECVQV